MNAMVDQHFNPSHGPDSRFKFDQTSMLVNPTLSYSGVFPPNFVPVPASTDNLIGSLSTPITAVPQIVFSSHASNYNTNNLAPSVNHMLSQGTSSSYGSTQPSPLEYHAPPGPLSQFPRHEALAINSGNFSDHSQDALSLGSHTPHSVRSKNSFSSFTDLRFPEQSDNAGSLPENGSSAASIISRSPFEPASTTWMDTTNSRLTVYDHSRPVSSHPTKSHILSQHQSTHSHVDHGFRSTDHPNTEMSDQQVKNLLMITNSTSSSTGKRKPREFHDNLLSRGEENFICKHCGKTFAKGYNLKSHLKTHSDERPFQCTFCPRSFARNHDKKRHELLHQGVKKFQCGGVLKDKVTRWGCGKRFSRADGLGRHFRTDIGWLCIRPLMLEAKEKERLEDENVIDETAFGTSFINDLLKKAQ